MLGALEAASKVIDVGARRRAVRRLAGGAGPLGRWRRAVATSRSRARERFPGLEFLLVSEGSLPFAAATFDGAWLGEVLEHVADVVGLLDEVARVLAPGGRLALLDSRHGWRLRLALGLSRRAFERHFEPCGTICVSSPPARSRACWRLAASSRSRSAHRAGPARYGAGASMS